MKSSTSKRKSKETLEKTSAMLIRTTSNWSLIESAAGFADYSKYPKENLWESNSTMSYPKDTNKFTASDSAIFLTTIATNSMKSFLPRFSTKNLNYQ